MNTQGFSIAADDLLTLFQLTPDLVCIAGKNGYFRNFNPAVPQTLGYTRQELFARPISDLIHPDDREMTDNRRSNLLKGETLLNFQNRYITKNGNVVWLEWTSVYLADKEVVFAIAKNITSRKLMEQQVEEEYHKLRHHAANIKHEVERDKKYIAAELHEDLAQLATSVRVDVDWISSNVELSEKSKLRVDHALATADLLVDTVRRISFSISPGMLDDLGLNATLEWYCNEFSIMNGIDCTYESSCDDAVFSKEISLDFFRVCQEALLNISMNSQATKVKISVKPRKGSVALSIVDDGVVQDEVVDKRQGILSMRERAASIGAQFFQENLPGRGRKIEIILPGQ
jgi:PAS domain S-box-containing protein